MLTAHGFARLEDLARSVLFDLFDELSEELADLDSDDALRTALVVRAKARAEWIEDGFIEEMAEQWAEERDVHFRGGEW